MTHELGSTPGYSSAPGGCPGLWFLAQEELTAREREVWRLMSTGYSDIEIAQQLAVNGLTVRFYVSNLLVKLGVSDRQEAVGLARQSDLVA